MNRINLISFPSFVPNSILRLVFVSCLIASHCIVSTVGYAEEQNVDSSSVEDDETASETAQIDLATDDAAYLTQLGLLRGHLMVGFELYRRSLPEMSETHMKHPNEELYADLIPAFEYRRCAGFADELTELARVVSERETHDVVVSNYELLSAAIGRCEAVAEQDNQTIAIQVVDNLLANALIEYEIGVIDGVINNVHEYQDAWGFTQVAAEYSRLPALAEDDKDRLFTLRIQRLIASLDPLWPSLNPTRIDDPNVPKLLNRMRVYTRQSTE